MSARIIVAVVLLAVTTSSFSPTPTAFAQRWRAAPQSHLYSTTIDPADMKLRDIQAELKDMGVSYTDCFDRDSLTRRLKDARNGEIPTTETKTATEKESTSSLEKEAQSSPSSPKGDSSSGRSSAPAESSFDREGTIEELRSLRVKELRTELANRNMRWGNMVEKEDLVQALLKAREAASNFSSSGALTPGKVADIDAETLTTELSTPAGTPLLLDVYATWCGPCQMMQLQLQMAAEELGDNIRVAKIDSDKYTGWASELNVGGLPTLIVFDGAGNEVDRVEGALMKDGLVQLARKNM